MESTERNEFSQILSDAFEAVTGEPCTSRQVMLWWPIFEKFTLPQFRQAITRAITERHGRLTPAAVFQYLPDPYGHPTPEEAWNAAPKTEHCCAYVTDEIMQALAACQDSLDRRDMIGARMAFVESYKNAVNTAKNQGKRAKFWFTGGYGLGFDEKIRAKEQAAIEAQSKGWLEVSRANYVLEQTSKQIGSGQLPENLKNHLCLVGGTDQQQEADTRVSKDKANDYIKRMRGKLSDNLSSQEKLKKLRNDLEKPINKEININE